MIKSKEKLSSIGPPFFILNLIMLLLCCSQWILDSRSGWLFWTTQHPVVQQEHYHSLSNFGQPKITKIKIWPVIANAKKYPKTKPTNRQKTKAELPHCLWLAIWLALVLTSLQGIIYTLECWRTAENPRIMEWGGRIQEWRLIQVSDLMKFYPRLFW